MRSPKKRSLLSVNEYFSGKRNNKRAFLVSLLVVSYNVTNEWSLKLLEVAVEETLEALAVASLILSHLMNSVVDSIEVQLFRTLGNTILV